MSLSERNLGGLPSAVPRPHIASRRDFRLGMKLHHIAMRLVVHRVLAVAEHPQETEAEPDADQCNDVPALHFLGGDHVRGRRRRLTAARRLLSRREVFKPARVRKWGGPEQRARGAMTAPSCARPNRRHACATPILCHAASLRRASISSSVASASGPSFTPALSKNWSAKAKDGTRAPLRSWLA